MVKNHFFIISLKKFDIRVLCYYNFEEMTMMILIQKRECFCYIRLCECTHRVPRWLFPDLEFHIGLPSKINNTNVRGKNNFTSGEVWIMHEAWREIRAVLQLQLQHMEHAYLYCISVRYIWARYNCSNSNSNSSSSSSRRSRPLRWKRSRLLIALAQLKFHGPGHSNVSTIRRRSI